MRFTIRLATPDQESWAWVGEAESKDDLDAILAEARGDWERHPKLHARHGRTPHLEVQVRRLGAPPVQPFFRAGEVHGWKLVEPAMPRGKTAFERMMSVVQMDVALDAVAGDVADAAMEVDGGPRP